MNKPTCTAVMSIHPVHVEKILSGNKTFEYRRIASQRIGRIAIYATKPVSAIVALVEVEEVLEDNRQYLWNRTRGGSGISFRFFQTYFSETLVAKALKLGRVSTLTMPVALEHPMMRIQAPQSYAFLSEAQENWLLSLAATHTSNLRIFVGGIHGASKSHFCDHILSCFGYTHQKASELIRTAGGEVHTDKRLSEVSGNQLALVANLKQVGKKFHRIAIDGHFCLVNRADRIQPISDSVFFDISPNLIIIVVADVSVLKERLDQRSSDLSSRLDIGLFQDEELNRARSVASSLNIPILVVNSMADREKMFLAVARVLQTIQNSESGSLLASEIVASSKESFTPNEILHI